MTVVWCGVVWCVVDIRLHWLQLHHHQVVGGATMLELELNTNINNYVEDVPPLPPVPSVPPVQNDQTPVRRGRRSRSEVRSENK